VVELSPVRAQHTRARTSDRVFEQLLSAIRSLALVPGQSLSETELSQQLEVSRTPLREAIARLADDGLVRVIPQVGTRVSLISMADVVQAQFVRETLEVGAFGAACTRGRREVGTLRALLTAQRTALAADDFNTFFELDEGLHQQIFVMAGYPGAWDAVQGMKVQLDRLRRLMPQRETIADLITEHTAIVNALEAGQRATGKKLITLHARRVLKYAPQLRVQFPDYFED
jgi:DNA-binding GntR family transcriptional regulator